MSTKFKAFIGCATLAVVALASSQAHAFHHHHRNYGSSGGSWGSSGGSWGSSGGSWGSSGGSWGSSGGSWGSSGGYYYGYGSSGGSWGSSGGSWGSSGGSSGGYGYIEYDAHPAPHSAAPQDGTTPPPAPVAPEAAPGGAAPAPTGDKKADTNTFGNGLLTISVPADAKVFVNGLATKSTGTERQFVSRGLQRGAHYTYEVRVVMNRDGKEVTETKSIQLTANARADLAFSGANAQDQIAAASPVQTTLTVRVPADAKVYLGGRETKLSGPVRQFTTTKLAQGEQWGSYTVRAVINRDGKPVTKEETISLKAGDTRELSFDFGGAIAEKVATATR